MKYFYLFVFCLISIGIGSTNAADWFTKLLETQSTSPLSNRFPVAVGSPSFPIDTFGSQQNQFNHFGPTDFQRQSSTGAAVGCSANPCSHGSTCIPAANGGFECKCPWGFTGVRCEICLTECASNPCPENKICKAGFAGGFECVCPPDRAGVNCEIQNDLCSTNPCHNGGVCKEIIGGSYICTCTKPWAGTNCDEVWVNPCTEEALRNTEVQQFKNPWDRNSFLICLDKNIYHPMMCAVGTYFNENLHHCVPEGFDPPKCPTGYCLNDGECIIDENNLLKCICQKGFSGERCAVNIDECASEGNAACQGGVCVDQTNGYYCNCPSGIGLNCQQTIKNPCTPDNINNGLQFFEIPSPRSNVYLHCTSEFSFSVRKCADNLHWHPEEQTCTVDKPPVKTGICVTFPCKNGGECHETGSSGFSCQCKPGFTGVTCDHMIDNCQSNPCQNGGTCVNYAGGYTCMCPGKVVDECCCHGVTNPCPSRKKIVPGVNNYFQHFNKHRYIHCDFEGRAFVRACAPGTLWNQRFLTCTSENMFNENVSVPVSYGNQPVNSYNSYGNQPLTSYSSYNSYQVPVLKSETTTQSYQQPSYQSYQSVTQPPVLRMETTTQSYQQPSYQSYQSYQTVTQPPVLRQTPETTTQSYQPSYQPAYQSYQAVTEAPVLRMETTTQSYQQPSYQSYQTVTQPPVLRQEPVVTTQSYEYQTSTQAILNQAPNSYQYGYQETMTTTTPQTTSQIPTLSPFESFKLLQELQQQQQYQYASTTQAPLKNFQPIQSFNNYQGVSNTYDSYQPPETTQATFLRNIPEVPAQSYNPYGQVQSTTAAPLAGLFEQPIHSQQYQIYQPDHLAMPVNSAPAYQSYSQQPIQQSGGYGSNSIVKLSRRKHY